jgi:hypothetical protein
MKADTKTRIIADSTGRNANISPPKSPEAIACFGSLKGPLLSKW